MQSDHVGQRKARHTNLNRNEVVLDPPFMHQTIDLTYQAVPTIPRHAREDSMESQVHFLLNPKSIPHPNDQPNDRRGADPRFKQHCAKPSSGWPSTRDRKSSLRSFIRTSERCSRLGNIDASRHCLRRQTYERFEQIQRKRISRAL